MNSTVSTSEQNAAYEKYHELAESVARELLSQEWPHPRYHELDDLVNQCWLQHDWTKWDKAELPIGLIRKIMRAEMLRFLYRERRQMGEDAPELQQIDNMDEVMMIMSRLKVEEKRLLRMRVVDGLTWERIGRAFGITQQGARWRYKRLIRRIRSNE